MRLRFGVLATAIMIIATATACGGSDSKEGADDGGLGGPSTTVAAAANANCDGKTLTAPEVGVTADTITVTVIADVENPIKPALFEGSWNGVKAWADYMNAEMGGLACRQIVVKKGDSKLSGEEAKNAVAAACGNSVALVGTTALFLQDVSGMESCKDKAGKATGIPDIADLQTEAAQQCSNISFATLPNSSSCPYTSGERTYKVGQTQYDYYFNKYPGEDLHGVFVIPKDLASTIASSMPIFRAENKMGIKSDAEFGVSGVATQPEYTQVVQAMKADKSNYGRNGLDYSGTVLMRKEAAAQGVDTVKIWDCSVQCYDKRLISEGGSAVEGQYVWLNILPLEDGTGVNPTLDAILKYNKKPDGFGSQAFVAGMVFAEAVNKTMAANGGDPNSITRANLLTAIRDIHDFTAGGMIPPTDVGGKKGSVCLVGMQVQDGKFVRISPVDKGQFDCGGDKPPVELTIDPVKEYKG